MSSAAKKPKTSTERMAAYRRRMREAGFRPVQIWIPDLRKPEVLAEYQRQARAIAESDPAGDEVIEWIDRAYEWPEK